MKVRVFKSFLITSIVLLFLGILSPWECSGDISWRCSAGIILKLDEIRNQYTQTFLCFMVSILLFLNILIVKSRIATTWKFGVLLLLNLVIILYCLAYLGIVMDKGGYILMFLTSLSLWVGISNFGASTKFKFWHLLIAMVILAISIFYFVRILDRQTFESTISGGTNLGYGIIFIVFGSLIMLFNIIFNHHTINQGNLFLNSDN